MSDVLVFKPRHELNFQKNYDEFIAFTKDKLTLFDDVEFDGKKGWECDKWSWMTPKGKKLTVVFGVSQNKSKYTPFKQPFSDFAKAYVRYNQSINHKDSTNWAGGFAWLYKALKEHAELNGHSEVSIMNLTNSVINSTENLIKNSALTPGAKRNTAISLQAILKFIKDKRLKLDMQSWTNPFPRLKDSTIKFDKESKKIEQDKCPSDYQMLQVADAFHRAKTPRQKYFASLCVMLMCQPSRSVELKGLTVNSLQKSDGEKGRWYFMWYPAKGGDPVQKWIPHQLVDVAKQAFYRLVEISAPARAAAKFAYDNPTGFMLHDKQITSEDPSFYRSLTYKEFATALGLDTEKNWNKNGAKWMMELISGLNGVKDWKKELLQENTILPNNDVVNALTRKPTKIKIKFPSYADLRTFVDKKYKTRTYPKYGDVNVWDCIALTREYEFHKVHPPKDFSWIPLSHGPLRDAIGTVRNETSGRIPESIFDEMNITDEDGSRLMLSSHQFRHWLNTKLKLAGESDWLIAKWSGRADINQNKAYDGRTKAQRSRLTNLIGHVSDDKNVLTVAQVNNVLTPHTADNPPPPMVLHDLGLPVSLKSLGVGREGVAQFTGLGYCVHDYAESPCMKNTDCETCSDHVCLKGMPNTLDELKNLEMLEEQQLERAQEKVEDNFFGADRWVTSIGFKLSKIKTLIKMLEDPHRKDGSPVRISDVLDPSPVKRSLNPDQQPEISPVFDLMALALSDMED